MSNLFFLFLFAASLYAQEKPAKPTEFIADSVAVYSVVWTADSIEYEGDKAVDHGWMQGHDWLDGVSFVRDSLGQRILPRICKKCFKKEFLYEHITMTKKETDYNKLQKKMILRKKNK